MSPVLVLGQICVEGRSAGKNEQREELQENVELEVLGKFWKKISVPESISHCWQMRSEENTFGRGVEAVIVGKWEIP